ncbi:hypothetical protein DD237_003559 [Peronospora effusa]|uniref:CBM20 domain-containing protein n=1 Tax=Peronospora effusa TaxID=542832 RepID=A0A425BXG7_9STRA|nr:hypothetical protein DD237_003559 [Peronospora effusa]
MRPNKVEFTVRLLDDIEDKHVLCLVGNVVELGAWDVAKAVPMDLVDHNATENRWCRMIAFEAMTNTLEYKYVVVHKQTYELVSWEGLPGNRILTIAAQGLQNVAL